MTNHPIQPIAEDDKGVLRFKHNAIVQHLLATHPTCDMNTLARGDFSKDDRVQFAQLIGYSLSGFGGLSYVDDYTHNVAATMQDEGLSETQARIAHLEHELFMLRTSLREPMARLFGIHPDDLEV